MAKNVKYSISAIYVLDLIFVGTTEEPDKNGMDTTQYYMNAEYVLRSN